MRAVLLDVSSAGRVPLLDSLFSMIDIWRSMKLNQIHLYSRVNTSGGSQWPWPYTKMYFKQTTRYFAIVSSVNRFYYGSSEIISLDRYCTDRGMELVPALDVEGDYKEPRVLQELVVTSQACFPSTK
jgi:hypothetical protein